MSSLKPISDESDKSDKENHAASNDENVLKKAWNILFRNKSAMWTAIFTGVLTIFTVKLYQVADTANQTTRSSQRALMNIGGLGLGAQLTDISGKWAGQEINFNWVNTGDTAAKAAVFQSNGKPELEDLPKGYDFPLLAEKTQGVVAPKGSFLRTLNIPLTDLIDAWHGKTKLFIWGDVLYRDVYPNDPERLSEFCVEITHVTVAYATPPVAEKGKTVPAPILGAPNTTLTGFNWQPCAKAVHMCYDDDCADYQDRVKDMR